MLHDPTRHEPLQGTPWDGDRVRATIRHIVADTEARFSDERCWPQHPLDRDPSDDPSLPDTPLYHGACGVFWALHYLQGVGAARLSRLHRVDHARLLAANRAWLRDMAEREAASFLMGQTPIHLMALDSGPEHAAALHGLIAGNQEHPARELMWGAPGTLLAALFLHERTGAPEWAALFRQTAATLWTQLQWSHEHGCAYWPQTLYGRTSAYLDAVHGFVATALPLIRGRHLLDAPAWPEWANCIANTVRRTAEVQAGQVNWRVDLHSPWSAGGKKLLQFCHGSPGFVICLAGWPGPDLHDLLLAAGETVWTAGPLAKGANLCHGTAGNGYALLKLYQRTGDRQWLDRARAFAMHALGQAEAAAAHHGQGRYSLWTGDLGLAIYLWDCLHGDPRFPTLDVFHPPAPR